MPKLEGTISADIQIDNISHQGAGFGLFAALSGGSLVSQLVVKKLGFRD
jgi:hypothetical protein